MRRKGDLLVAADSSGGPVDIGPDPLTGKRREQRKDGFRTAKEARSMTTLTSPTRRDDNRNTQGHVSSERAHRPNRTRTQPHTATAERRHNFASGLIAAGCDVVTVQRALGHARATTTLDTYSHLWPSAEDRTRDAAANLMLESAGQYRATPGTASL
jgi:integrase